MPLSDKKMVQRAVYEGFIVGLAYVQAQEETLQEKRYIEVDFPYELWDPIHVEWFKTNVFEFMDALWDQDDGGILEFHFIVRKFPPDASDARDSLRIQMSSPETDKGLPEDWEEREHLTMDQAQKVLEKLQLPQPL